MSENPILEFVRNGGAPSSLSALFGWASFAYAAYQVYYRRDTRTGFEWTMIAWQFVFVDLFYLMLQVFEHSSDSEIWRIELQQYLFAITRLVVPTAFTLPIVWGLFTEKINLISLRLFVVGTLVAFLDVLLYLVFLTRAWRVW